MRSLLNRILLSLGFRPDLANLLHAAGLRRAPLWPRISSALRLVSNYLWLGFGCFVLSLTLAATLCATLPLALGSTLIAVLAFIMGYRVVPTQMQLDRHNQALGRLHRMGVGRLTGVGSSVTLHQGIRRAAAPLRATVLTAGAVLLLLGLLLTVAGERVNWLCPQPAGSACAQAS